MLVVEAVKVVGAVSVVILFPELLLLILPYLVSVHYLEFRYGASVKDTFHIEDVVGSSHPCSGCLSHLPCQGTLEGFHYHEFEFEVHLAIVV